MATASKNLYCSAYPSKHPYTLSVSFSESSPNAVNNTSIVNITGKISASAYCGWDSSYNSYLKIYWHDDRTNADTLVATSSAFQDLLKSTSKSVSKSITVTHKTDGKLSGYAKVVFEPGSTSGGYCPAGNNVATANTALTSIPRASSISSITATALGSSATVNISRAVSTFVHKVEYKVNNSSWTLVISNAATSATFTPSVTHSSQNTTGTTVTLYVRVTTLNGTTPVGSAVTSSKVVNIPTSVVPSFTSVTASRIDNGVPTAWGVYVKGHSQAKLTINGATGIHGSTIKSYSITGGGLNATASSATTGVLETKGTITFTATITDSRGRQATETTSINVEDYSLPSISVTAKRCTSTGSTSASGTYLRVTCTYSYASVASKNTITRSVTCNSVTNSTFTSGTAFTLAANCSIGSQYTLTATIKDGLGKTATATANIPTDIRAMNFKKNLKAVAFGGFATEDNTVKSYWKLYAPDSAGKSRNVVQTIEQSVIVSTTEPTDQIIGGLWLIKE